MRLTQGHPNQFGGLEIYKTQDDEGIAHSNYVDERRYASALEGHMKRGSRRIFSQMTGDVKEIMPMRGDKPLEALHLLDIVLAAKPENSAAKTAAVDTTPQR